MRPGAYPLSACSWRVRQVRLGDGSGKQVKPCNLELADTVAALAATAGAAPPPSSSVPPPPRVAAFWGDARWSRTQLLGEISKGHWGLCKASVADVVTAAPSARHGGLRGRLAFAPVSEMTEDFMRAGQRAMDAYQLRRAAHGENVHGDDQDDEEDEDDEQA